ncbi:MAG TPA: PepSY domain-containing protein [Cellulomonas sp.]
MRSDTPHPTPTRTCALLLATGSLALLVTGCTGSSTPTPTVTVTAPAPEAATAGTGTGATAATGSAAGTSGDGEDRTTLDLLESYLAARTALVDHKMAWQGGDLDDDPTFRRLRADLATADHQLEASARWLTDDAAVTAGEVQVSAGRAVQIAADLIGGDVTTRTIELDEDDHRITWELELAVGGVEHDVSIDAGTGAVLEHDSDD